MSQATSAQAAYLLRRLSTARDVRGRLRILAESWQQVSRLSKADRAMLAQALGFQGADRIVNMIASRHGVSPKLMLSLLDAGKKAGPRRLAALAGQLRSGGGRKELAREGLEILSRVLEPNARSDESETEDPLEHTATEVAADEYAADAADALRRLGVAVPAVEEIRAQDDGEVESAEVTKPPVETPVPVKGAASAAAGAAIAIAHAQRPRPRVGVERADVERVGERNTTESTVVPPPEIKRSAPQVSVEPSARTSSPPSTPIQERADALVRRPKPESVDSRPRTADVDPRSEILEPRTLAEVIRDIESTVGTVGKLRTLRENVEASQKFDHEDFDRLLQLFESSWSRRRALSLLLRAGIPKNFEFALELIDSLGTERARAWCLGALIEGRELRADQRTRALSRIESPAMKRRYRRRLEKDSEVSDQPRARHA